LWLALTRQRSAFRIERIDGSIAASSWKFQSVSLRQSHQRCLSKAANREGRQILLAEAWEPQAPFVSDDYIVTTRSLMTI
jgi:hypothetical protein